MAIALELPPAPKYTGSNFFRKLAESSGFVPVDDLRIQDTFEIEAAADAAKIESAVRDRHREWEDHYRHLGGGGLGFGEAFVQREAGYPVRVRYSLFPLATGENRLMQRLAWIVELASQPEPDTTNLPLLDMPEEYRMSDQEFDGLLSSAPRNPVDLLARIDEMKRK